MDSRSFEGPMDWEYQDRGPFDPTSPFAHAASKASRSTFGSPLKSPVRRDNPFANLATPSKSQPLPPQSARFTPQVPARNIAPPFRNPAFTTPRRPVDETILSEASGPEDSPAVTEVSDYPNDTPDADHRTDVGLGSALVPLKIDKSSRYGKSGLLSKKHASGKGEIRAHRELSLGMRKRKRHNYDRDVGSVVRHRYAHDSEAWDSDSGTDNDASRSSSRSGKSGKQSTSKGAFETFFQTLNKYPNTPDHMQRWIQFGANLFLVSVVAYIGWSIVSTVRNDIYKANINARELRVVEIAGCKHEYNQHDCQKNSHLSALRVHCKEWYDCMRQDPDSVMSVKVMAKQVAEIINEFSDTMHLKAWGIVLGFIIVCTTLNASALSRQAGPKTVVPPPPARVNDPIPDPVRSPAIAPGYMLVPLQTPKMQRRAMLDEGTDTDTSPLNLMPSMPIFTPSGRRSPSKGERQLSPIKFGRGANKGL
ncbi:hypothetical protein HIM_06308 [Hirsutella minnesotensis 3608]|uniref:Brl1/Brr6 domain-containing protein n=1 Tax=Hirsutella minnesotensis 3608 TaxID=1043627 RepID=A0A0F7ZZI9_9HYPO|nr:hypothetical protein HIM_06308 [Hirsutella minnesotensis 3608]